MASEMIGGMGGKYRVRVKDQNGNWGHWLNLGGGLKTVDVEVELVQSAQESSDPMWNALLNYVLDNPNEDPMDLLRLWREGSFDVIRKEWPDVPNELFPKSP